MSSSYTDLLHDLHNYSVNISTREIFLHNSFMSDDNQNPGVEYKMASTFVKNIKLLEHRSQEPIVIHMQSIGGEWADGMAIYDSIILCKSYVTIISYGQAESMSSLILQAADNRLLTPNSYFMVHYGSTSLSAGTDYLNTINWIEFEKRLSSKMLDIYSKRCVEGAFFDGKDETQVKKYLSTKLKNGDWFLDPVDAVYYGFADGVVS